VKTLIVEDELTSRVLLREILKRYGPPQVAMNGVEAVDAVRAALQASEPFDLICLDIIMPEMDGQEALKRIRKLEEEAGIAAEKRARVIMTTAHADRDNVLEAIRGQCDYFLVKPIDKGALLDELRRLGLIDNVAPQTERRR
jgi:two-component system, chemotaxis family, chemotaxis protein CheY